MDLDALKEDFWEVVNSALGELVEVSWVAVVVEAVALHLLGKHRSAGVLQQQGALVSYLTFWGPNLVRVLPHLVVAVAVVLHYVAVFEVAGQQIYRLQEKYIKFKYYFD